MNPLLFIPSPRDIPEVKKTWHTIPYDKFIVKYMPQYEAYQIGRSFFLEHDEYTHIIICPDDLELSREGIEYLVEDAREHPVVSGICNIDETRPDKLAIYWKKTCQFNLPPSFGYGEFLDRADLPEENIFEIGHSGFCCEIIEREVFKKVKWVGATADKTGNFDWQFSRDCNELDVPIVCDKRVNGYHRRFAQLVNNMTKKRLRESNIGYTIWLKER